MELQVEKNLAVTGNLGNERRTFADEGLETDLQPAHPRAEPGSRGQDFRAVGEIQRDAETIGRPHHIAYTSANASAVASAVLSGLAVSIFPESGLRPGMRVLSPADGFPELPGCRVGLIRNPHESLALADALAEHIISSLDNLSEAAQVAAE